MSAAAGQLDKAVRMEKQQGGNDSRSPWTSASAAEVGGHQLGYVTSR